MFNIFFPFFPLQEYAYERLNCYFNLKSELLLEANAKKKLRINNDWAPTICIEWWLRITILTYFFDLALTCYLKIACVFVVIVWKDCFCLKSTKSGTLSLKVQIYGRSYVLLEGTDSVPIGMSESLNICNFSLILCLSLCLTISSFKIIHSSYFYNIKFNIRSLFC